MAIRAVERHNDDSSSGNGKKKNGDQSQNGGATTQSGNGGASTTSGGGNPGSPRARARPGRHHGKSHHARRHVQRHPGKHNHGVPLFMSHLMLDLPIMRVSTVYNWREGPILARDKDGTIRRNEVIYQTTGFPESFLVSREGHIVERYIGPREWDHADYVGRVRRLMEERPLSH